MVRQVHISTTYFHVAKILVVTWLLLSLGHLNLQAQAHLPRFYFTRSDSVVFLDRDITNFQLFALLVDKDVEPQPFPQPTQRPSEMLQHWIGKSLPQMNAVGGSGDERSPQGYAAVANFYEAIQLWMVTGRGTYLDYVERALMAGIPATMFSSPDPVERSVAAQAMMDASQMVYVTDTAGLFINFFLNTFAHIPMPSGQGLTVDMATTMPWGGMMKMRIRTDDEQPVSMKVRLRLPEWGAKKPNIYVDGIEVDYTIERGYAVIDRTWHAYDELYMVFDVTPKTYTKGQNSLIHCGPIVYCTEDSVPAGVPQRIELVGEDGMSHHPVYALVHTSDGDTITNMLRPYFETPADKRHVWHRDLIIE